MERGITIDFQRSLMEDSQRQSEDAATEIRECLEPYIERVDPHRAYAILKLWYRYPPA